MSKNQRMIVEALAPPFLVTVCIVVLSIRQEGFSHIIEGFLSCLLLTYVFGIFPAFLYMVAMELWFHFGWRTRCGLLCTIGYSTLLGTVAAYLSVTILTLLGLFVGYEVFFFLPVGAFIGLLIGFYVGRKEISAT